MEEVGGSPYDFPNKEALSNTRSPFDQDRVFVMGRAGDGQLGCGSFVHDEKVPIELAALRARGVVQIASGGKHSLAVTRTLTRLRTLLLEPAATPPLISF